MCADVTPPRRACQIIFPRVRQKVTVRAKLRFNGAGGRLIGAYSKVAWEGSLTPESDKAFDDKTESTSSPRQSNLAGC